jgi:thiol-disulfide isomerase/thioredoxin
MSLSLSKTIATLLFVFMSSTMLAQEIEFPEVMNEEFIAQFTEISDKEANSGKFTFDMSKVSMYDKDSKKITIQEMSKFIVTGEYTPVSYVDSENAVRIMVLRKSTPEEKEAILAQMNQATGGMSDISSAVGKAAIPFELVDMEGNIYNSEDLKGKVIVFNFWFISCPPCVEEMPELNELVAKYKGKDVVFIAVATDRERELKKFLAKKDFDYNIIPQGRPFAAKYEVQAYPTHIVIDKDFMVTYGASGFGGGSSARLESAIEKVVNE